MGMAIADVSKIFITFADRTASHVRPDAGSGLRLRLEPLSTS